MDVDIDIYIDNVTKIDTDIDIDIDINVDVDVDIDTYNDIDINIDINIDTDIYFDAENDIDTYTDIDTDILTLTLTLMLILVLITFVVVIVVVVIIVILLCENSTWLCTYIKSCIRDMIFVGFARERTENDDRTTNTDLLIPTTCQSTIWSRDFELCLLLLCMYLSVKCALSWHVVYDYYTRDSERLKRTI